MVKAHELKTVEELKVFKSQMFQAIEEAKDKGEDPFGNSEERRRREEERIERLRREKEEEIRRKRFGFQNSPQEKEQSSG